MARQNTDCKPTVPQWNSIGVEMEAILIVILVTRNLGRMHGSK